MYNIRFVSPYPVYNPNARYLRQEDVVHYLMELAAGEDTDTRERIEAAARILNSVGINNGFSDIQKNKV